MALQLIVFGTGLLVVFGDRLVISSVAGLIKVIGLMYLLHFAFATFMVVLTIVFKRKWISILIGGLCSLDMMWSAYNIISDVVDSVKGLEDFDMRTYSIERNINLVYADMASTDMSRALLVGMISIILAIIISAFTLRKRDV